MYDKFDLRGRKILFWEVTLKQDCTFPQAVEYKSGTAKIYHQKHRGGERFEVRYYDVDGSMQRLTFPTYSSATKFAETAVKEIAANREHFVTLRGRPTLHPHKLAKPPHPVGKAWRTLVKMEARVGIEPNPAIAW